MDNRIEKEYKFKTYLEGLGFANKIGHIADEQDHHPDISHRMASGQVDSDYTFDQVFERERFRNVQTAERE